LYSVNVPAVVLAFSQLARLIRQRAPERLASVVQSADEA
jgi:hypothetical protein